ncbi:MAG: hypothetical protein GWN86_10690, partial [Desulfobacterales bacterium]|nr:hypothetical protein [Desulfobacterales bacterium]
MSEEEIQEEVEQEPEVEQELEQEAEQEGESESERQARAQGWAPKEEWRGPEDQWVDADTFLERGQKNNAILRERNEKLFNEIQSLKDELRSSV